MLLAALIGVLLIGRGQAERRTVTAAPRRCVSLWNGSSQALSDGYHNFHGHGYEEAEVVYLDGAGDPAPRGSCAVVFPSATLDPERAAAAKVYRHGRWEPLSAVAGVDSVRLSELQVEAVEGVNAYLRPDGTLDPIV